MSFFENVTANTTVSTTVSNTMPAVRQKHPLALFLETYYSMGILIFGTVGNLMSLAVLSRKTFRSTPIGICLRVLVFADLSSLYTGPLYFTAKELYDYNFREVSEFSCRIHRLLSYMSVDLAAWTLVVVSTARLTSVMWPMKNIFNYRRTYIVLAITLVIILGVNSPTFFLYGTVHLPHRTLYCVSRTPAYRYFTDYIWTWIVLFKFALIPALILTVMNVLLLVRVFRSRREVEEGGAETSSPGKFPTIIKAKLKFDRLLKKSRESSSYIVGLGENRITNNSRSSNVGDEYESSTNVDDDDVSNTKANAGNATSTETIMSAVADNDNNIKANTGNDKTLEYTRFLKYCNHKRHYSDCEGYLSPILSIQRTSGDEIAVNDMPKYYLDSSKKSEISSSLQKLNTSHYMFLKPPGVEANKVVSGSNKQTLKHNSLVQSKSLPDLVTSREVDDDNMLASCQCGIKPVDVLTTSRCGEDCTEASSVISPVFHRTTESVLTTLENSCQEIPGNSYNANNKSEINASKANDIIITISDSSNDNHDSSNDNDETINISFINNNRNNNDDEDNDTIYTITSNKINKNNNDKTANVKYTNRSSSCKFDGQKNSLSASNHQENQRGTTPSRTPRRTPTTLTLCPVSSSQKGTTPTLTPTRTPTRTPSKSLARTPTRAHITFGGNNRNQNHRSLTMTVIAFNAAFILSNFPIVIYMTARAYIFSGKKRIDTPQYVMEIFSNYSLYTNNAINFILYCIMGVRFRRELKAMFKELFYFLSGCRRQKNNRTR